MVLKDSWVKLILSQKTKKKTNKLPNKDQTTV